MKIVKLVIADDGKMVSTDGKKFGKVICYQEGQQIHEISEEEWHAMLQQRLQQRQAENEEVKLA